MKQVITNLESLGLANSEARVYLAVLQTPNVNGSQLAKQLDIPKPSIYLALDKLYQRGMINLIPGKAKQYLAQSIDVAFEKLRKDFNQHLDEAITCLQDLQPQKPHAEFIHVDGYGNYLAQVKQILNSAQVEIYLHTNSNLEIIEPELTKAIMRGVRVVIYSFGYEHNYCFDAEVYHDKNKPVDCTGTRLLLVADNKIGLMASGVMQNFLAIYTENPLQVSLLSENIHNAIYWLKLYQLYPNFDYPCRLNTLAERDIHISGYSI